MVVLKQIYVHENKKGKTILSWVYKDGFGSDASPNIKTTKIIM